MTTTHLNIKQEKQRLLFNIHRRYLRSTHLELDWNDPAALDGYTFTPNATLALTRISLGLEKSSSLRAWRITGDYGSGKSSFALLIANIFDKRNKHISTALKKEIYENNPKLLKASQSKLAPILITGNREPLAIAILNALLKALKEHKAHTNFTDKLEQLALSKIQPNDQAVLEWVKKTQEYLIKSKEADGIIIIIDEAGKFLEYAATNPEEQDIYLLQSLAEMASRSGPNPIYIFSIFHQGISSYAERLSKSRQREWEKIAGRYEEIIWHYPVEQTAILIASALNTELDLLPKSLRETSIKDMAKALEIGLYGTVVNKNLITEMANKILPIHPTVVPVMVKLFSNFGQNERSLYTFLLGNETFGLQNFTMLTEGKNFFRLHNLYDYAKAAYGAKLANLSYYWKAIDGIISTYPVQDEISLNILKIIGIINLINASDLIATKELLTLAFNIDVTRQLAILEKAHVLHFRGYEGGYCVWPNTSVNLEECYVLAKKALLDSSTNIKTLLKSRLTSRPLVARRHYIETGNLRYFDLKYVDIDDLKYEISNPTTSDGLIFIPLCINQQDVQTATDFAQSLAHEAYSNIIIVIPSPLQHLSTYLDEVRCWEWIEGSVGELRQDRFAREEVSRQLSNARLELQRQIQFAIGLGVSDSANNLNWYYNGAVIPNLHSTRDVMAFLSTICDQTFNQSPKIQNELINRRELSSAGASARLRLCERLLEYSDKPYLEMDSEKRPPEMSMYLSVLQESGLHVQDPDTNTWAVKLPSVEYDLTHCNVLPALNLIHSILNTEADKRVRVDSIFQALKAPPYGVREGIIPLFIAVFCVIHEDEIALYEDGSFLTRITGTGFLRLIKAPETFEIQYYPITAVRSSLFQKLIKRLGFIDSKATTTEILDVVKPLMLFIASLPEYVLNTSNLTSETQKIRSLLTKTTDPVQLLFSDLPIVCGLTPFSETSNSGDLEMEIFATRLKASLDELRSCYAMLLNNLEQTLLKEFDLLGSFEKNRSKIANRANALKGRVTDIRLKSFCVRLSDIELSRDIWLESLGNVVCAMPPKKWRDKDVNRFDQDMHKLIHQFMRVEATFFSENDQHADAVSVRLSLTKPNGEERDQVIYLSPEENKKVQKLESEIKTILAKYGQVGMAAASNVLWAMMSKED
jgi:hypothetical protein